MEEFSLGIILTGAGIILVAIYFLFSDENKNSFWNLFSKDSPIPILLLGIFWILFGALLIGFGYNNFPTTLEFKEAYWALLLNSLLKTFRIIVFVLFVPMILTGVNLIVDKEAFFKNVKERGFKTPTNINDHKVLINIIGVIIILTGVFSFLVLLFGKIVA